MASFLRRHPSPQLWRTPTAFRVETLLDALFRPAPNIDKMSTRHAKRMGFPKALL